MRLLESHFSKLAIGAFGIGLVFGFGFLIGKTQTSVSSHQNDIFHELSQKEKTYQQIQDQVKLTYYKELLQRPKTEPIEKQLEEETVTKLEQEPQKPPAVADVTASSKRMAEALAHVLGNDTPDSVQQVIEQSLPASTGSAYAIQIASFPSKEEAQAMRQKMMQNKGYDIRMVQADIPGRGIVYRLRIHGFHTRQEAESFREKNQIAGITVAQ